MREWIIWLVNITGILGVILLGLFFYLLVKYVRNSKETKLIEKQINMSRDLAYRTFVEGASLTQELIPDTPIKKKAMETIIRTYFMHLNDSAIQKRLKQYVEEYFVPIYREQLKAKSWSVRMNTLQEVIEFEIDSLTLDIEKMLKKPSSYTDEELLKMCHILSLFKTERLFQLIEEDRFSLNEMAYRKLFYELDEHQMNQALLRFPYYSEVVQCTLIDMVGINYFDMHIPFLEQVIMHSSKEIRIRAMKSLAHMGVVRKEGLFMPFIQSEYWEERMMVAKLFAYSFTERALEALCELAKDESWWVRNQAVQSIGVRDNGEQILEKLNQTENVEKVVSVVTH